MAALAIYLAGLCDYSDKLDHGERGVVLLLAPDMKQAKVLGNQADQFETINVAVSNG